MNLDLKRLNRNKNCPICDAKDVLVFFNASTVPVNVGIQWATRQEARQCPKGKVKLAFCRSCNFIWNTQFDTANLDYTQDYENSLFHSPLFRQYSNELAQSLISRYSIRNKTVIDIGCGKGDFLFLLCELGNNSGIGFDTSYKGDSIDRPASKHVKIIRDFYSEKYTEYQGDLICSRYVFEHIPEPKAFLKMLRNTLGDRSQAIIYFEVPNVSSILRDLSVWDIIYEHCSYFGASSLKRVFTLCGFDILGLYESYAGQQLGIEATVGYGQSEKAGRLINSFEDTAQLVGHFCSNVRGHLETWRKRLAKLKIHDRRAVLWGAGAKGVSFLNMLEIKDQISYVVDINPCKHGKYIPGTGQKIVPPEFLQSYRPNTIIMTNNIYKSEIERILGGLGIQPEFML